MPNPNAKDKPRFVMPRPFSVVLWRPAQDMDPCPAFVTGTSREAISVVAFPPDARMGVPKDGVRHIDDPVSANIAPDEGGIWDFTEDQKLLRNVLGLDSSVPAV
jgi:hypothetical protein